MSISYKYIVLAIIVLVLVYILNSNNSSKKEKFDVSIDNSTQIIFNADTYLKNLTESQARDMLVSSKTLPFVRILERNKAESVYNKLFVDDNNLDGIVKDIISVELDDSITIDNDNLSDEEKIVLFNDVLKNLQLNKSFTKTKVTSDMSVIPTATDEVVDIDGEKYIINYNPNTTADEIDAYANVLGFTRNYVNNTLSMPSLSEFKANLINNKTLIKKNNLLTHADVNIGSGVLLPKYDFTNEPALDLKNSTINTLDLENLPDNLKYRVRNNRELVANALANIMNSKAIQNKWEWTKINKAGVIISDTTVSPSNVLLMKKSIIKRLFNVDINSVKRPRQCLNSLNSSQQNHIYNILLNLNNTEYNSDDKVLDVNFINSNGQSVYEYPQSATEESLDLYQNKIKTILEHIKIENIYNINPIRFIRSNSLFQQDDLGLPLFLYDHTPEHKTPIKITRGIINVNGDLEETSGSTLQSNDIIYFDDDNKTQILKVVGEGEDKKYQIYMNDTWNDFDLLNSFEWYIPELEKRGRNQSNLELKFDLVAINNSIYNILLNSNNNLFKSYDNFVTKDDSDELKLPIAWKNAYPLTWDSTKTQMSASRDELVVLSRKKVDPNDMSKLIYSDNKGELSTDEFIVGPLGNILAIKTSDGRYTDSKGVYFPETDISETTGKIGWKAKFLEDAFNASSNDTIKKEFALINRLVVSRANTELVKKQNKLPYGSRNKASLVVKIPPDEDSNWIKLDDGVKNNIYSEIANTLSNYNIVLSGSKPEVSASSVSQMNRKNLASLMENGIQNIERLIIRNTCMAKESYPSGNLLKDVRGDDINYFYISDIRRLQKAIFSAFNTYMETEDGLQDIEYAGYRLQLLLNLKGDERGTFILNQIPDTSTKNYIRNAISLLQSINFKDSDSTNEYIENNIISRGLTLEMLNDIYSYINLDDYLSIKMDVIKDNSWFTSYYNEIDNNIVLVRNKLQNLSPDATISDDDIMNKYNYVNARNVVNETKERISSMKSDKKLEILSIIRANIVKRQENNSYSSDLLLDIVTKNITLETSFKIIKSFHLNTIVIENNTSAKINNNVLETFDDLMSANNYDKYYKF